MHDLEKPDCPICESNDYELILKTYSKRDNDYLTPYQHLSVCKTCGLVSLNPRQSEEAYQKFYSSRNTSKLESLTPSDLKKSQGSRDVYRLFFNMAVKRHFPKVKTVLDIGAGLGLFASYLKEDGFSVEILEPSQSAVNYAKNNFQLNGYVDFIETANLPHKFDALVMTALIEHLLTPRAALAAMKNMIHEEGIIYICTPDILECVPTVSLGSTFTFQHVYSFTENSLKALLAREGFEVVSCYRDPAIVDGVNCIYPGNFLNGRIHVVAKSVEKKTAEETRCFWEDPEEVKQKIRTRVRRGSLIRFFAHRKRLQIVLQRTIGKIIRPTKPLDIRLKKFNENILNANSKN